MKGVTFRIQPPLPRYESQDLPLSETLAYEEFTIFTEKYTSEYILEGQIVSYGLNNLYYIYIDVCEELDRLDKGEDHDLTMSFYPVLRVFDLQNDVLKLDNISDNAPEPRITPVFTSRSDFIMQLSEAKRRIEDYVRQHQVGSLSQQN